MRRLKRTRFAAVALWRPRLPQPDAGPSDDRGQVARTIRREPARGPLRDPRRDAPEAPGGAMCSASSSCAPTIPGTLPLLAALGCLCALLFERLLEAQAVWRSARFARLRARPG